MAMAFLAKEGRAGLEQIGGRGAMRVMADAAIFSNRLVVMHERTALFHMAHEAGLVDAVLLQLLGTR